VAKEYAEDLEVLTSEDRVALAATISDLTSDTARTPLAASRFKRFMDRIGKPAAQAMTQIVVSIITDEAKRQIGLK
jgi:hypothetical protein